MGRQNFFMEPIAAGKAGAENSAATRLIRKIQDIISSSLLERDRNKDREPIHSSFNGSMFHFSKKMMTATEQLKSYQTSN